VTVIISKQILAERSPAVSNAEGISRLSYIYRRSRGGNRCLCTEHGMWKLVLQYKKRFSCGGYFCEEAVW